MRRLDPRRGGAPDGFAEGPDPERDGFVAGDEPMMNEEGFMSRRANVSAGEERGAPGRVTLRPIGVVRSVLQKRADAPRQGSEGAPDAWLEVHPWAADGLQGLAVGDELIVITWLHQARRETLRVHPRDDARNPLTGVFATRSPDRPNPLGLHPVRVLAIEGGRLRVGPLEAIDGTPVVDLKPVLR